jgi:hypothetical protein
MDKFSDIKFNDLTDEQMSQMTETEIINKALSEYVYEINGHTTDIISCRSQSVIVTILTIMATYIFGFYGLFGLIPLAYFVVGYFKLQSSLKWHVRSFKSTASMYGSLGFDYLVEKHIKDFKHIRDIGRLYTH